MSSTMPSNASPVLLKKFIDEGCKIAEGSGKLSDLLNNICVAVKGISAAITTAGMVGL